MTTVYGTGILYGAAGANYGRISSELAVAQEQKVRETGLTCKIFDDQLNAWEYVAGAALYAPEIYQPINGTFSQTDLGYYSYRGKGAICKLANGNIVRIRLGDGSASDRQIYIQTVTDPTIASQWTTWSVLYSGTHYSVAIVPTGASSFIVYHTRSDGLYRNNSKLWSHPSNGIWLGFYPTEQGPVDRGFAGAAIVDPFDGLRDNDLYYTTDVTATNPINHADVNNFRWQRNFLATVLMPDGRVGRLQSIPMYFNARNADNGIGVISQFVQSDSLTDQYNLTPPRLVRGLGGGAGRNWFGDSRVFKLSDGFYYLFSYEIHEAPSTIDFLSNVGIAPVWQRSKDLVNWSEPIFGPGATRSWGFAGVVESGGYLYWADSGQVWRRPTSRRTIDITNYVPNLSFSIPRDNQAGSGQVTIANPGGINDQLLGLEDKEIEIKLGIRTATGQFEFEQFDRFFLSSVIRTTDGDANRLEAQFGNLLTRLDNQLRDPTNFVGRTEWNDWQEGAKNQPFNYYFASDTRPIVGTDHSLQSKGVVLFTAWKGQNPDITFRLTGSGLGMMVKYLDPQNFVWLSYSGSVITLFERVAGVDSSVDSWNTGSTVAGKKIRFQLQFERYRLWANDVEYGSVASQRHVFAHVKPGYVGFYGTSFVASDFHFEDWEYDLTFEDLIRTALAMGDFHEASVSGATGRAFAIIWGPQTDVATPADGLRTMMEANKLQLVWRDSVVAVGKFNDPTIIKVLDNRIIQTDQEQEGDRQINLAAVDGNENSWLEVDVVDGYRRGRQINAYFDLPELLDVNSVKARALEEIARSKLGSSPGGNVVLYFDLWRMDHITWIDNVGNSNDVRVEGISVEVNQSTQPSQRMTVDTSLLTGESFSV